MLHAFSRLQQKWVEILIVLNNDLSSSMFSWTFSAATFTIYFLVLKKSHFADELKIGDVRDIWPKYN